MSYLGKGLTVFPPNHKLYILQSWYLQYLTPKENSHFKTCFYQHWKPFVTVRYTEFVCCSKSVSILCQSSNFYKDVQGLFLKMGFNNYFHLSPHHLHHYAAEVKNLWGLRANFALYFMKHWPHEKMFHYILSLEAHVFDSQVVLHPLVHEGNK